MVKGPVLVEQSDELTEGRRQVSADVLVKDQDRHIELHAGKSGLVLVVRLAHAC